jgi:hypothetical protein
MHYKLNYLKMNKVQNMSYFNTKIFAPLLTTLILALSVTNALGQCAGCTTSITVSQNNLTVTAGKTCISGGAIITGTILINSGATLEVCADGTINGQIDNTAGAGTLNNYGTILASAASAFNNITVTNYSGGVITYPLAQAIDVETNRWVGITSLDNQTGATINVQANFSTGGNDNTFTTTGGGTLNITGNYIGMNDNLVNSWIINGTGTFTINAPRPFGILLEVINDGTIDFDGKILFGSNTKGPFVTNNGTISGDGGIDFKGCQDIINIGVITNTGKIFFNDMDDGSFTNSGTMSASSLTADIEFNQTTITNNLGATTLAGADMIFSGTCTMSNSGFMSVGNDFRFNKKR